MTDDKRVRWRDDSGKEWALSQVLWDLAKKAPCRLDAEFAKCLAASAEDLEAQASRAEGQERLIASMAQAAGWRA